MDLIRPWLVGAVSWPVLMAATQVVFLYTAPVALLGTFVGNLVLIGVPVLLVYALTAVLASWAHRAPERSSVRRNALAALAAPVLWTVVGAVAQALSPHTDWAGYSTITVLALAGAVAGWAFMLRVRARSGAPHAPHPPHDDRASVRRKASDSGWCVP